MPGRRSPPAVLQGMERIGFVGTGRMGANMARRLHDTGYHITALFDLDRDSAQSVASEVGGRACEWLRDVTDLADIVITVVTDDTAMERIFSQSGDSLLEASRGKLFMNCATVSPQTHVEVEARVNAQGGQSLEACMASSIPQARNGTLYLMVAGDPAAFDRARPILEKMSASVIYLGTAGRAAQVKALVNMVMNANTAALAEGLGLGDALGLDLDLLREIFAQTGANSRVLETDGLDMQKRDYEAYFSAEHAAKDSAIALALGEYAGLRLPIARATLKQYERLKQLGFGHLDKSAIAELTFKSRHG